MADAIPIVAGDSASTKSMPVILVDPDGKISSNGEFETVAASQTDQVMGAAGAIGDVLASLVCVVATAATAQVQIKDGAGSAITVLPNSPGGGVGTYTILLNLRSLAGAWKITTGAGVSVIATGNFT
ncbi:hypothetical protein LB559_13440 [Mesorhizobium sp. BR1-1-3]|uniref:hypothetical protein n=1 Tax=Mesorhizobium sp. BR1-1-3 TaxID=2876651 RepID=UPI001CD0EB10|nr:hypothetical protein [Mesorhizobium sp. BR1-1-3]MBZ9888947.1 hypothetical protein [Mesorhizobium sp. BR1-1-3]